MKWKVCRSMDTQGMKHIVTENKIWINYVFGKGLPYISPPHRGRYHWVHMASHQSPCLTVARRTWTLRPGSSTHSADPQELRRDLCDFYLYPETFQQHVSLTACIGETQESNRTVPKIIQAMWLRAHNTNKSALLRLHRLNILCPYINLASQYISYIKLKLKTEFNI